MEQLGECYTIRGAGGFEGCIAIQEKLQDHGLCSYTREDPEWPHWRFFFETNLRPEQTLALLGKYAARYRVQFR